MNTSRKGIFLITIGVIGIGLWFFAGSSLPEVSTEQRVACEDALRKRFSYSAETIEREIAKCGERNFAVAMTAKSAAEAAKEIADVNRQELSDVSFRNYTLGVSCFLVLAGGIMLFTAYRNRKLPS